PYWFGFLKGWDIIVAPALLIYTVVANPGGLPDHLKRLRDARELKKRRETDEDIVGLRPKLAASPNGRAVQAATPSSKGLLRVEGVSVTFGGLAAVADASLEVREGAAVGLIGPHGARKSPLCKVISGLQKARRGKAIF